jgi:hypothetical protein
VITQSPTLTGFANQKFTQSSPDFSSEKSLIPMYDQCYEAILVEEKPRHQGQVEQGSQES